MDWSLFWNAVGGIAQAAAAVATFLAVGVALWLGIREGRRSLRARYDDARPVLLITSSPQNIPVQQGNDIYLDWNQQQFSIEVRNVGNGPALNVRSVIYGPEAIADASVMKHLSDRKDDHWYHWTTDAVSQGEKGQLQYTFGASIFFEANKRIESRDHKQTYPFNARKQPLPPLNQKESTPICRVTVTYQDLFHRKHASIYDLFLRQGWQVVALLDDIVSDLDDLVE